MATNNNGHLVDDKGNVVVDFVWGNLPLQPNDDRVEPNLLDYTKDNHIIADANYGGYPLFVANSRGSDTSLSADYITVPSVLGKTTALAIDALEDAGFTTTAGVNTITTATAATNTSKTVTDINRTAASHNLVFTASGAGAAYGVGTQVVVSGFSNSDAFLNGTYTVTANTTNTFTVYTTATDAVALTGKSGAVVGLTGTIKTQSIAANTASVAPGTAITITPWA